MGQSKRNRNRRRRPKRSGQPPTERTLNADGSLKFADLKIEANVDQPSCATIPRDNDGPRTQLCLPKEFEERRRHFLEKRDQRRALWPEEERRLAQEFGALPTRYDTPGRKYPGLRGCKTFSLLATANSLELQHYQANGFWSTSHGLQRRPDAYRVKVKRVEKVPRDDEWAQRRSLKHFRNQWNSDLDKKRLSTLHDRTASLSKSVVKYRIDGVLAQSVTRMVNRLDEFTIKSLIGGQLTDEMVDHVEKMLMPDLEKAMKSAVDVKEAEANAEPESIKRSPPAKRCASPCAYQRKHLCESCFRVHDGQSRTSDGPDTPEGTTEPKPSSTHARHATEEPKVKDENNLDEWRQKHLLKEVRRLWVTDADRKRLTDLEDRARRALECISTYRVQDLACYSSTIDSVKHMVDRLNRYKIKGPMGELPDEKVEHAERRMGDLEKTVEGLARVQKWKTDRAASKSKQSPVDDSETEAVSS